MTDRPSRKGAPLSAERRLSLSHEFNELFQVIEGYARLAAALVPKDSPVQEHLEEILSAVDAAAGIAREIGGGDSIPPGAMMAPPPDETPIAEKQPTPLPVPTPVPGTSTGARVLLVDDDRPVRLFTTAILRLNGFDVVAAASGSEAMDICRDEQGRFEVMITDVVMSPMPGDELIQKITAMWPNMRCMMISGFPGESAGVVDALGRNVPLLDKPFTAFELVNRLRELISGDES